MTHPDSHQSRWSTSLERAVERQCADQSRQLADLGFQLTLWNNDSQAQGGDTPVTAAVAAYLDETQRAGLRIGAWMGLLVGAAAALALIVAWLLIYAMGH